MKKIAVYCGAASGANPVYERAAKELGEWLVANNYGLVYGGGQFGLMGAIARAVLDNGGHVDGIIPKELDARGATLKSVTNLEVVENMTVRKGRMMELADGFLALPGGPGTLEEISEVYSWSIIGDNKKPCVLYNINHYYDPLKTMYQQMTSQGFLTQQAHDKLLFSDSMDKIREFMENYQPPKIREY
ncbi:LOG family protein [Pediococcus claussenii]|uniref:Cytokinin riboside 5'-monophosphate phosphoribohydrolase n=1 Tax=Pediococcus claussenii (strain ATCC BAA-344 / DSM 14800 / JCM 18046 / KCTC 3811 / LMG 21948 / P06) TaxID=701521 RepID=G8PBE8_PEDCP|nr:TIGR00730 family Rossman fold protein [Pediococcus claussenii]AEV95937.1 putative lysine decarboxylase family protein [Pediococcus claussenii ATCC BAA-344]ANZ69427.1 Rossman fold protein, TIGR00730 family [Pediococcus claussenii]ANZ71247.1 Rossman fold protein, TIGR00730 family [Pediococcus claussenii]